MKKSIFQIACMVAVILPAIASITACDLNRPNGHESIVGGNQSEPLPKETSPSGPGSSDLTMKISSTGSDAGPGAAKLTATEPLMFGVSSSNPMSVTSTCG